MHYHRHRESTYVMVNVTHFSLSPLKTMTPDKFFPNLSLAKYLAFFGTRFGKITACGVFLVTDLVKET
jgi:hypothetical protein